MGFDYRDTEWLALIGLFGVIVLLVVLGRWLGW